MHGEPAVLVDSGWAHSVFYRRDTATLEVETLKGEYAVYHNVTEAEYANVVAGGQVHEKCKVLQIQKGGYEIWVKNGGVPILFKSVKV